MGNSVVIKSMMPLKYYKKPGRINRVHSYALGLEVGTTARDPRNKGISSETIPGTKY